MSAKVAINDSTIARIAGNLLSGFANSDPAISDDLAVERSVALARAIAAEVERTRPSADPTETQP